MGKKPIKIAKSLEDLFEDENHSNRERLYNKKSDTRSQDKFERSQNKNKLNNSQNNSQYECPSPVSNIAITKKAFSDMIIMAEVVNAWSINSWGPDSPKMEIFCYVLCNASDIKPDEPAVISEIFIPRHTASETAVEVSSESILEVQKYIRKHKKVILGWAHSHGHFEVYSSKVDEKNHRALLLDTSNYFLKHNYHLKYIYGITINDVGERFGVILTEYPCGHIQRNEDLHFKIIGSDYNKQERKNRFEELKRIIFKQVLLKKPSERSSSADLESEIKEELLNEVIHRLRRAKFLLFEDVPDFDDQSFTHVQKTLQQYDELIVDSVEESFKVVSDKLYRLVESKRDNI